MTEDPVRSTLATYDRVAADYDRRNAPTPDDEFLPDVVAFADAVGPGGLVADAGCGPGRDAGLLRSRGLRVTGFDGSASMTALTRAKGVPVARADLRALPVRPGALDGLWSVAALLHVPRADVPETLRGWRSALRDGGALGLTTALGDGERWEVVPYAATPEQGYDTPLRRWFVYHGRDDLLGLVEAAGFAVRRVHERTSHRHWLHVLAVALPPPSPATRG